MSILGSRSLASRSRSSSRRGASRLWVVALALGLGFAVVAVRLVQIQLVDGRLYAELARRQYESRVVLQAERGAIYDRNGNLLATNALSWSYAVDPRHVGNRKKLADAFVSAFGGDRSEYLNRLSQDRSFVWIRRKVIGAPVERLKDLEDNGLIRLREPLRRFEYDSLAAQVLGYTDVDNNGLSGIEGFFNDQLRGRSGMMIMQRDALGRRRPDIDLPQTPPEHGSGLVLTIDVNVQSIVEQELAHGVRAAGAASGTAIALDPASGEILAMVSWPEFDPNNARTADPEAIRVRSITDTYEPGSTMKAITAAAAIEEGVVDPEEEIDGHGGQLQLGGYVIRDDHPMARMTFRQAIEESSNVGFATIATRLPEARFYKYVRDFGFGIDSGIDLPGEVRGDVRKPDQFGVGTQQFMAFGYQLAVTPLQLVCAYASIANGGVMMKPHLLKRRLDRDGEVIEEIEPQRIRRVVSEETAGIVRDLLVGTVERGTGQAARIPGLRIAGKTGTSQQIADGSYSKSKYNASFIGFFPADEPQVALLVLLDSPTNGYYGGQVAAPIFREIARRIVNASLHGSEPELRVASSPGDSAVRFVADGDIAVPDVRGLSVAAAQEIAERYGFRVLASGSGPLVVAQRPLPSSPAAPKSVITLATSAATPARRMPDLRGLALRRAVNLMNAGRLRFRVNGSGRVVAQSPAPGSQVDPSRAVAAIDCR